MAKRTTMRSSKGTKLYAVRDKEGKFEDIQTYKRAHGQDIKRKSKAERRRREGAARKSGRPAGRNGALGRLGPECALRRTPLPDLNSHGVIFGPRRPIPPRARVGGPGRI